MGLFTIFAFLLNFHLPLKNWPSPLALNQPVVIASNTNLAPSMESQVTTEDSRPILIKKYLAHYNSPLLPYADLIFSLSKTYNLDYRLILAIGQQESNLCKKIPENSHNCWGYGIHKRGTLTFASYELALKSYAAYLKQAYIDKGLTTIEQIESKYNPSSNGSWSFGVNQFMEQIETGEY